MLRLALLLCLLPVLLLAQPDTLWTRTLDSPGYSWLHGLCPNGEGGCLAVGEGPPPSMWNYDLRLVWVDSDGHVRWDRLMDTGMDEYGRVVFPTADGGYAVAGGLGYTDDGVSFVFLMKLDDRADVEWFHRYEANTMGGSAQVAAAEVPGGGFVVLGTMADMYYGQGSDPLLIRVNANGDSLWSHRYTSPSHERGDDVIALSDGFAILAARLTTPVMQFWLIRTDLQGDTLWTRSYDGGYPDWQDQEGLGFVRTSDGGFLMGGSETRLNTEDTDIRLIRVRENGDTLWTRVIGGSGNQIFGSVKQTDDGGFVVAGSDSTHSLLVRLDFAGTTLWTQRMDMPGIWGSRLADLMLMADGGCITVGSDAAVPDGTAKPLVLRTTDGHLSGSPGTPVGTLHSFALRDCYPNPFNSATRISFELPVATNVNMALFDITGRNVATVVDGNYAAGSHTILFDGDGLASGMYFYQVRAGSFVATRKMMLLR